MSKQVVKNQNFLNHCIKSSAADLRDIPGAERDCIMSQNIDVSANTAWSTEIIDISYGASITAGLKSNSYFCPEFRKTLRNILPYFPL